MLLRKYWIPLSVFIVAIVGVSLYVLQTRPPKDPILIVKPVEYEKSPAKAPVVEQPEPVGHVHEDGTFHADTPAPVATPTQMGTLTYHTELLDRHPVEALRQQAKERGHWSADHIPPFPPEDHEAAVFARDTYLFLYYMRTGQTDHPAYIKAAKARDDFFDALSRAYDAGFDTVWELARNQDLMKISWTMIPPMKPVRLRTTFTVADGINLESARELFPFELEMSLR